MLKLYISFLTCLLGVGLLANRGNDKIWVDDRLEECRKGRATHYVVVAEAGDVYDIEMYTIQKKLRMKGQSLDAKARSFEGYFEFYYPNGEIESKGNYIAGAKVGVWDRFDKKGNRLAERTYAAYDAQRMAYTFVDEMPMYDGGVKNFREILKQKIEPLVNKGEFGDNGPQLEVGFVVSEDGQLRGVELTKGLDPEWNVKANKAISSLPSWIPGKKSGETVRVFVRLPIDLSR